MADLSLKSYSAAQDLALADAARDRKDWPKAMKLYRAVLDRKPGDAAIWVQYGHALKESGSLRESEEAYRRSISLDPAVADTYLQLGHAQKLLGNLVQAHGSYEAARKLEPNNKDALRELEALDNILPARALERTGDADTNSGAQAARAVFDCSDLVQYFQDNRLPTGIQRVQINVIKSYLSLSDAGHNAAVVYYDLRKHGWSHISSVDFYRLINTARNIEGVPEQAWQAVRDQIYASSAPSFSFVEGDVVVNLGTSWWIPDYFAAIRNVKKRWNIKYLPFIHDCIPLMTPEYCSAGLVQEFTDWIQSVFAHADGYLVNSESTSRDLIKTARQFGYEIDEPQIVRLDGDTRNHDCARDDAEVADLLEREGIAEGAPFVMFVATLEARKNHTFALRIWDRLIAERGAEKTPHLICVGKKGWLFESTEEFLRSRRRISRRVRFVSNVSDTTLAALYKRCLFTFYPSHYEGWGLPVTESLCHGKVPVVAQNSSLTEAGGDYAVFFESGSERQAGDIVVNLIDDAAYRTKLERKIADDFAPRSWQEVALDVSVRVAALIDSDLRPAMGVPPLVPGQLLIMKRPSRIASADYHLSAENGRVGEGWHACEDWGCWTREKRSSLSFTQQQRFDNAILYVSVRGNPVWPVELTIACLETSQEGKVSVPVNAEVTFKVRLGKLDRVGEPIHLTFTTNELVALSGINQADTRSVGVGVLWIAFADEGDLKSRLQINEATSFQDASTRG
jgi:glycosyltransferase involved in cell wall biosynthesis